MTTPTRYTRDMLYQARTFKAVRRAGLVADLVGGADFNIFDVSGTVLVQYLFGQVTTVIGAGAAVPRIQFTPTGGAQTPLCVAAVSIANDAVGTLYVWDGTSLGVLAPAAALGTADAGEATWVAGPILLTAGIIAITNAVVSSGIIDWYISYLPLVDTTIITAL